MPRPTVRRAARVRLVWCALASIVICSCLPYVGPATPKVPEEPIVFRDRRSGTVLDEVLVVPIYGRVAAVTPIAPDWAVGAGDLFLASPFVHRADQRFEASQPWIAGVVAPISVFAGGMLLEFAIIAPGYRTLCVRPDAIARTAGPDPDVLAVLEPDRRARLLWHIDPYAPSLEPLDDQAAAEELRRIRRLLDRDAITFTPAGDPEDSWLCPTPPQPAPEDDMGGFVLGRHQMDLRFDARERALIDDFLARGVTAREGARRDAPQLLRNPDEKVNF